MRLASMLMWSLLCLPVFCRADKVIMKDGRVYEGRIMGETARSVMISNPKEPRPQFLPLDKVLTVIRDTRYEPIIIDYQRYAMVELAVGPAVFTSRALSFSPTALVHTAGGLRVHRWVQVDGEIDWIPRVTGGLTIQDQAQSRSYSDFQTLNGGFSVRLFPLTQRFKSAEPYVIAGYQWSRVKPVASGDRLNGSIVKMGIGVQRPWREHWYWDSRFLYQRARYGSVDFLANKADLVSSLANDHLLFLTGLSYHWH